MELNNNSPIVLQRENGLLLSLIDVSNLASPLANRAKDIVAHALFELFANDFDGLFAKNGSEEFSKMIVEAITKRELEYIRANKELFESYLKANEEQYNIDKKDPYFRDRDDFEDFYRLYLLSAKFTILVKKDQQVLVISVNPLKEQPEEEKVEEPLPEPVPVVEEKKEEEPQPEPQPEPEPEPQPEPKEEVEEESENEEVEAEMDENGNIIRITKRTFLQKLELISDEYVQFYEEIRKEALSYGLKSRVSSSGDAFSSKRINYLKIGISGRTLKLHYRLDPKDYAESPIPVEDDSSKSLYVDIPLAFRVKSKLAVKRAKHLLADAMKKAGIKKLSHEELAKLFGEEKKEEPKKAPKAKPVPKKVEKKPEEPKKEEKPIIIVEEQKDEDEDEDEEDKAGFPNITKRTFYEKLLRVRNETRHAYKEIKEYGVDTYGLTSRVGASGDALSYKRKNFVKLQIFGKTLKVRYRLNPKDYAESKIPVDDDSDKKIYEDLPLSFKVKSDLAMKRAKKLIDDAMKAAGISKVKEGK